MTIEELEIVIRANITDAIDGIKKITDEVKNAVSKSVEPMKQMTNQAKAMASNSASSVSQMKAQMKSYGKAVVDTSKQQEYLKSKIQELEYQLHQADLGFEVGDTMKIEADIEKLNNRLIKLQGQSNNTGKEITGAFGKIKASIKNAISNMSGFGKKFKEVISNSKNMGKSLTGAFNNGIKSIKKFALSLLSVRTAFSMISRAMQSYLSFDTQLSNSIQNCWNVLGSLLAPILEYLVSLFTRLVSYVNAFVKALTGVDLVARANAKAIDKQTKSTKKMSEAQSSLDEFHTINKDSSGDGNSSISVGEVDTSKLDVLFGWIDKAKKLLSTLFEPFKQIDFTNLENSLKNLYNSLVPFTTTLFDGLMWFYNNILVPLSIWVISDVVPAFLNILAGALKVLNQAIIDLQPIFIWLWENALKPLAEFTGGIIVDVLNGIGNALNWIAGNEIAMAILEGIAIAIGLIATAIGIYNVVMAVCNIVTGIFSGIMAVLTSPITLVVLAIGALIAIIILCVKHWETIKETAIKVWEKIKEVWNKVATWFNDKVIKPVKDFFAGMWNGLKEGAKNAWNGIKNVFSSVASFFKNIFSNAWNGVKNIFSAGGKVFSGIKDGIANAFKKVVNTLIAGINKVVAIPFNAINTALRTVRDISFLGIEPFKGLIKLISVPQIPSLATGGVLSQETLVRVAEYNNARTNPEIVSPKDMMKETFKEAIEESGMNNISSQKVEVEVTGETKIDGDDIVIVYDKAKNNKGYNGGKNPSFAY